MYACIFILMCLCITAVIFLVVLTWIKNHVSFTSMDADQAEQEAVNILHEINK
jgi:uncharacterized membrane protein